MEDHAGVVSGADEPDEVRRGRRRLGGEEPDVSDDVEARVVRYKNEMMSRRDSMEASLGYGESE